jgi:hypothetical protein
VLLEELPGSWGALLAPSPDVVKRGIEIDESFSESLTRYPLPESLIENIEEQYGDARLAPLPWDLMVIGFNGYKEVTDLVLVYHYPDSAITEEEVDLARTTLSEIVSPNMRIASPEDLFQLNDLQVREPLLVARGTTQNRNFLGNTIEMRDISVQCYLSLCREEQ